VLRPRPTPEVRRNEHKSVGHDRVHSDAIRTPAEAGRQCAMANALFVRDQSYVINRVASASLCVCLMR